ncbi:ydjO [Escherichia coli]|nr:ydjO [Escherichia coli]
MMSLWDALRMNMMISYQELVRTFLKTSSKFVEYCHPEIQVHNQYKQLSTMFNFISDMFFNSDPYQTETLLVFSF